MPSISLFYWFNPTHPVLRNGRAASSTANPANLRFPGRNKPAPGAILSLPAGGYNTLRISYFRTQGQGNTTAGSDLTVFSTDYGKGDYLSVGYTLQYVKLSLDYLSWPFPLRAGGLRIKTLWEAQYTSIRSAINAPLKPTTDSAGNSVQTTARGSNWFIYPSFGLGIEAFVSKHVRWETSASGFTLPHRSTIWNAETQLAYRHGQFEILLGARGFHFKTSPKRAEYVRATLAGPYLAIRWYP